MAELINNREHRIETMASIIGGLHAGGDVDEVRAQLRDLVRSTDAAEIAAMEQVLISRGLPVEQVMAMCDLHAEVTSEILVERRPPELDDGHPVSVARAENRALGELVSACRAALERLGDDSRVRDDVASLHGRLTRIDVHYQRKEHLFFPVLERYGIDGPSTVMWARDDVARQLLAAFGEVLRDPDATVDGIVAAGREALDEIESMIFKEEQILLPMALQTFTDHDWDDLRGQLDEIGFAWIDRPVGLDSVTGADPAEAGLPEQPDPEGRIVDGGIRTPSGSLTNQQLLALFRALPVDLTFVDADDRVAYFTEGADRVFARPRAIVGRKVQQCHPPASVDVVERIVSDFRSGAADTCSFWIEHHDQFILIRYCAVRGDDGDYLGTLEITQDLTRERALTGERRLLDYES